MGFSSSLKRRSTGPNPGLMQSSSPSSVIEPELSTGSSSLSFSSPLIVSMGLLSAGVVLGGVLSWLVASEFVLIVSEGLDAAGKDVEMSPKFSSQS